MKLHIEQFGSQKSTDVLCYIFAKSLACYLGQAGRAWRCGQTEVRDVLIVLSLFRSSSLSRVPNSISCSSYGSDQSVEKVSSLRDPRSSKVRLYITSECRSIAREAVIKTNDWWHVETVSPELAGLLEVRIDRRKLGPLCYAGRAGFLKSCGRRDTATTA